jgi:hypothetical protein
MRQRQQPLLGEVHILQQTKTLLLGFYTLCNPATTAVQRMYCALRVTSAQHAKASS